MPERGDTIAAGRAEAIFRAFDAKDIAALAALATDDVRLQIGNAPVVEGKRAFVDSLEAFVASVASFSDADRSAIAGGNATRLFGL